MVSRSILTEVIIRLVFALLFIGLAIQSAIASGGVTFWEILLICFATSNLVTTINGIRVYRQVKKQENQNKTKKK